MKYHNPSSLKPLTKYINSDKFIEAMFNCGEIYLEKLEEDYSSQCYNLCRNATAWILKQIFDAGDELLLYQIEVVIGRFGGNSHTWLKAGNYYVDLTLAQFVHDAPNVAITKISKVIGFDMYLEDEVLTCDDWIKYEKRESAIELSFENTLDISSFAINGYELKL